MTGLTVGGLILVAFLLLVSPGRGPAPAGALNNTPRNRWRRTQGSVVDPAELPLFVHQLTALLHAGRSPQQLWEDIALVYLTRGYSAGDDSRGRTSPAAFARQAEPVLLAAQHAAAIGAGVPAVFREAAVGSSGAGGWRPGRGRTPPADCAGLWRDLAVCLEISERSGAPLAEVLTRYAAQLDLALDAAAARAAALAGPQATARLLGWLPLFGLALGYLTGAQPLAVLFGSLPGLVLLMVGLTLMVLGRLWSSRLVAAASRDG